MRLVLLVMLISGAEAGNMTQTTMDTSRIQQDSTTVDVSDVEGMDVTCRISVSDQIHVVNE